MASRNPTSSSISFPSHRNGRAPKRTPGESNRFKYKPLESPKTSIRLLKLDPTSSNTALTGKLEVAYLDEAPNYEALSYVWGSPERADIIWIGKTWLGITANLAGALRKIRTDDEECVVWIDAICIDQENTQERGHQLKHMSSIYKNADQVLVYLGEPKTKDIKPGVLARIEYFVEHRQPRARFRADWKGSDCPSIFKEVMAISKLSWFRRVWTTQEIGLAQRALVFLGCGCTTWDTFTKIFKYLSERVAPRALRKYRFRPERITLLHNFFRQDTVNFLEVLAHTHSRGASDPRDRVFAMLSHPSAQMHASSEPIVEPNYDWNTLEVYRQTAIGVIKQMKNLDILSYVWHQKGSAAPSWVPLWECSRNVNPLIKAEHRPQASQGFKLDYRACFRDRACFRNHLFLRGWKLGVVQHASPLEKLPLHLFRDPTNNNQAQYLKRSHFHMPNSMVRLYATFRRSCISWYGDDFASRFGSTLTCDRLDPGYHVVDGKRHFEADRAAFLKSLLMCLNIPDTKQDLDSLTLEVEGEDDYQGSVLRFAESAWFAYRGRSIFSTEHGIMGLGPCGVRPGDSVYILQGGSVPYALRPNDRGQRLIGECHVEEFMEGQLAHDWETKRMQLLKEGVTLDDVILC